jgi:L-2-hydroxyglutarate oxidase LhgO
VEVEEVTARFVVNAAGLFSDKVGRRLTSRVGVLSGTPKIITNTHQHQRHQRQHTNTHHNAVTNKVAAMVGDDSFSIKPRIGEYLLLKRPAITVKEEPPLCRHIVFPCPGPMGKGILVQPTLW